MKLISLKSILYFCVLACISGCASWMQVVELKSSNTKQREDVFYHENDSILVTYYFWAERGVMSFTIYNKLNVPLYVDWKKSSLITNSVKLNYWSDDEVVSSSGIYKQYSFTEKFFNPVITLPESGRAITYGNITDVTSTYGEINSTSVKSKAERITFIPPQSNYYRTTLRLCDFGFVSYNSSIFKDSSIIASYNKREKEVLRIATINNTKPILVFRNFLTMSTSEDFKTEFYIDNRFEMARVIMMSRDEFNGPINQDNIPYYPYRKANSFYFRYPENQ